jgi:hypothetical protein
MIGIQNLIANVLQDGHVIKGGFGQGLCLVTLEKKGQRVVGRKAHYRTALTEALRHQIDLYNGLMPVAPAGLDGMLEVWLKNGGTVTQQFIASDYDKHKGIYVIHASHPDYNEVGAHAVYRDAHVKLHRVLAEHPLIMQHAKKSSVRIGRHL